MRHRGRLVLLCCATIGHAQVVVNEVLPVPPTGEPEWVEVYNGSDTTAELTGWWIADLRTAVRLPPLRLPARGYAVLTRDTAALREVRQLPEGVVLCELRLPTLNNTSDAVILRRADSVLVDSLFYSLRWGRSGISLERRQPTSPAWSPENLAPCQAPTGATPGELNSITPVPSDYQLREFRLSTPTTVLVVVENTGTEEQAGASCTLWIDRNHDSVFTADERCWQQGVPTLMPGHRWQFTIAVDSLWAAIPEGWYECQAVVNLPGDARRWNDTLRRRFYRSIALPAVRINEILYEPVPGGAEFVELVNVGPDTLVLEGWKLHDWSPSAADTVCVPVPLRVPPGGFAVIAWDSAIVGAYPQLQTNPGFVLAGGTLALNNTGDVLVVRDPNGVVVDSLAYTPEWHDPVLSSSQRQGRSLEKLHPLLPSAERSSWSSSAAALGATPGELNSIAVPLPREGTLTAAPNPLRLSSEERRYCVLSYELPFGRAFLTVRLFTEEGAHVRTLAHALFTASTGYVVWDGRTDRGELVPPGIYVVLLEAEEAGGGRRFTAKAAIVVGY